MEREAQLDSSGSSPSEKGRGMGQGSGHENKIFRRNNP